MPSRFQHRLFLLLLPVSLMAAEASAYDYSGFVNLGGYGAQETDAVPSAGSQTNDASAALGSVYLDVTKITSFHNEFTLDFRDRYDSFGRVDPSNPRLVADNEPQLRELAIKYPYENGSFEWALGRVPIAGASVLGNDGVEAGYKVTARTQLGVFGGLYPEERNRTIVPLAEEDRQGGVFAIYQDRSTAGDKSTYAATSLVLRQPVPNVDEGPQSPLAPVDVVAPVNPGNPEPTQNYAFWYANIVHQASANTRFTYLQHVDLQPQVHVRDLWASVYHQVSPRLSGDLSLLHLDLTEYERQRDFSDPLQASELNEGRFDLRFKSSRYFMIKTDLLAGERTLDGKARFGGDLKLVATSLAGGHLVLYAGGGYRKDFIAHDEIAKGGLSVFTSKLEFDLDQSYMIQTRDTGQVLHPMVTDLSAGYMLSEHVLGSLSLEYAHDEQATVYSGLVTLGYRFTNRQLDPMRDRSPRLERL